VELPAELRDHIKQHGCAASRCALLDYGVLRIKWPTMIKEALSTISSCVATTRKTGVMVLV
jgi:hypothetical protein